ncbi:hypothetical protein Misp06_01047 [Microbulbifer sp. NBRC 101763]
MIRIDKRNHVKLHYFCASLGVLSFVAIVSFLVFVFIFKDFALSIVVNKEAFIRDFSSPTYFMIPLMILVAIFLPYYYFLVFSRSIYLDLNKDVFIINGNSFPSSSVRFFDDFVYFGLCFSFVETTVNGRKCKIPFIAKGGIVKALFWVILNPHKSGMELSSKYRG